VNGFIDHTRLGTKDNTEISLISTLYKLLLQTLSLLTRLEAGSNTSTVTLRVVGSDEEGSLKSETVKYGLETKGPRTQEGLHWRGPIAYAKDRPILS
jgi:hypothetical protein